MCALRDLADQDAVRVRFVCVPDEESEDIDTRSIDEIVRGGFPADFAITGEPTDLHVGVQAKGVLAFRLNIHGRSAHGSTPWLGDNAVLKAIDVFRRIESLPFSRESSEMFDRPSVNLGRIHGGDALNKVPDLCTMVVDIRYLPNQDPGDILAQIRSIPDIEVVRTFTRVPADVSRTNPYVVALVAAVGRLTEGESMSVGRDGASDAVVVPAGGHPGGRVRARRRRSPRARGVGVDLLARPLPPDAVRLRRRAAARARPSRRAARRRGRARVSATGRRRPPRVGRGLLWRGLLAGVLICLMTAGAVSAAVLLQVDEIIDILKRGGPRGDRDPRDRPRRRRQGADADDPRLRSPLRRQGGRHPAALGHDHPRPAGPGQGGDRDDLDPARPARRRSRASATRSRSTRRTRTSASAARARGQEAAHRRREAVPDQPRDHGRLRRLPARDRLHRLRLRRHRPRLLQRRRAGRAATR